MRKILFLTAVLFLQCCAALNQFTSAIKNSGLRLDEERFGYINWRLPHQREAKVVNGVYDGDTLVCDAIGSSDNKKKGREGEVIRLLGIDTPEIAHPEQGFTTNEPGALEAAEFVKKNVNWKEIILITDPENLKGVFGRTLGLIFYQDKKGDTRCLNWELLKRGRAKLNLYEQDLLCDKKQWENIARMAKLSNAKAYIGIARMSLKERFVYDALDFYNRGIEKYPESADIRKDIAALYGKLASLESNKNKKKSYAESALFHWMKLKGTKYDSLARREIRNIKSWER